MYTAFGMNEVERDVDTLIGKLNKLNETTDKINTNFVASKMIVPDNDIAQLLSSA